MAKLGSNKITPAMIYAGAAVSTASILSFGEFLLHSSFLDKYRKILAKYKRGVEVPLHKDVRHLFKEVLDDMKVKDEDRYLFTPFTITGFDLYNAGYWGPGNGVIIGIPGHFIYKNKNAVDILDIRMGPDREPLNPYDPITDNLVESFVFSNKAKKFAIAREVLMSQKNLPMIRSIENVAMISISAFISNLIARKNNSYKKPFLIIASYYVGVGLISFATWFQIRDGLHRFFEKSVDKELAELGPDYVEGGKEFYDKLLKKNKAVRKLLGPQGKNHFNSNGDEIFFIRQKRTPITQRKQFFDNYNKVTELPKEEFQAV